MLYYYINTRRKIVLFVHKQRCSLSSMKMCYLSHVNGFSSFTVHAFFTHKMIFEYILGLG